MDRATRRRLADELLADETEYHLALERHDLELTDESRRAWMAARRRMELAMELAHEERRRSVPSGRTWLHVLQRSR